MRTAIAGVLMASAAFDAAAQENKDLERIPEIAPAEPPAIKANAPEARTSRSGRLYVEDALALSARRGDLVVPAPPPAPPSWQNRTSLDLLKQWDLDGHLSATLSDRFNVDEQQDVNFPSRQSLRTDLREGYLTWQPRAGSYLEAGRVNIKNGVALGFNPTDFFKTRTLVDQSSLDPSVIRQNRLGSVMARGQAIWQRGSASLSVAPKLESPAPIATTAQPSLSPSFDRTNGANRVLLTASYDVADLNPQALVYNESGRTKFGLNLSHQIGKRVVGYVEWAAGKEPNLITQAMSYGRLTGTLPPNAPTLPPTEGADKFRNDLAIGASWTSETKITLNLEYHYHEAGFSKRDWKNWFDIGAANANRPPVTGELWYVRGFAAAEQQPMTRQQVFLRAAWPDAFVVHLELTALAFVNLYDGSTLAQLAASYDVSDAWTLRAFIAANIGGARSERGSMPQAWSVVLQVVRYF